MPAKDAVHPPSYDFVIVFGSVACGKGHRHSTADMTPEGLCCLECGGPILDRVHLIGDDMEPQSELIEGSRRAAQAVPMSWRRSFRRKALEMAKAGHEFTSEDVTSEVQLPEDVGAPSNNSIGRMMAELSRQGWVRCVGFRASTRKARRGGGVRVWQGTDKAKEVNLDAEPGQTEIAVR